MEKTDDAKDASARWSAGIDWAADMEGGSFRLLPMVHANLAALGCNHPQMNRLAGIYRYHWFSAQSHIKRGLYAVRLLREAEIPVMVSKGLALACSVYPSPALRPMSDIDLLVRYVDALRAFQILTDAGWTEPADSYRQWSARRADMLVLTIGCNLRHHSEGKIDLHWALMHEAGGTGLEDTVWASARQIKIGNDKLLRLSATLMLLHVIAHGLRPNALSPLRWVVDAAMLLSKESASIDWPLFHQWASRLHVGNRVRQGLTFLRDEIKIPIPNDALPDKAPVGDWLETLENRAWMARMQRPVEAALTPFDRSVQLARLIAGNQRGALSGLAAGWLRRRLGSAS